MSDQNKLVIKDNCLYTLIETNDKNKVDLVQEKTNEEISVYKKMSMFLDRIANKSLLDIEENNSKVFVFPDSFLDDKNKNEYKDSYILKTEKTENNKIKMITTQETGNIIGFIGGNIEYRGKEEMQQLIIKSRFDSLDNDYFMFYMLGKALKIPFVHSFKINANPQERALEYYIFLLPYYLREAIKKGLYKTYIRRQYNDANVKGVIDVRRHISKNIPFAGRIAYSQREFSYDNYLMELIRHTIEFVKKKYGKDFFNGVSEYVKQIEELTSTYNPNQRRQIINENKKNIVRSAYYSSYRKLQELCIWILDFKKIGMGGNSDNHVFGVLFDASWIWEEYINTLIKECFYHPQNKEKIGTQHLFKRISNGKKCQKIYPDFIGKDSEKRVIADAKYKPIGNIGRDDYFQVLAYMFRFDAQKGYYLYPESNEDAEADEFEIPKGIEGFGEGGIASRENDKIIVVKHGLRKPATNGEFRDFERKMKKSEEEFIKGLID